MSPINRYKQVTDVVIAYNTWVDCKAPWQIGVGQNKASADVLPKYEIRSEAPIRSIIANNLIYNTIPDEIVLENHDAMEGILFSNNVIDNAGTVVLNDSILKNSNLKMKQLNSWLYVPENEENQILENVYVGFNFEKVEKDLFGASRNSKNKVGAISDLSTAETFSIDKKMYGPKWFSTVKNEIAPSILIASSKENQLQEKISAAKNGDIIELSDSLYIFSKSLKIDKNISIRSKNSQAILVYNGEVQSAAFEMYPNATLTLQNVTLKGNKQLAFAPLKENMGAAYNLFVKNCTISNFEYVLKAYKASFADVIQFDNSNIINCENGFVLAADEKGDYNVEFLTFKNCNFKNVAQNVINFYRGGYDESTIGGYLSVIESSFVDCGSKEKSGILIKTHGIINVNLQGNVFKNNAVKHVAILWGEKNNEHSNNTLNNSGLLTVEQQQKQEILY
jgi:poly(beta-D-mannuronate) lyase